MKFQLVVQKFVFQAYVATALRVVCSNDTRVQVREREKVFGYLFSWATLQ